MRHRTLVFSALALALIGAAAVGLGRNPTTPSQAQPRPAREKRAAPAAMVQVTPPRITQRDSTPVHASAVHEPKELEPDDPAALDDEAPDEELTPEQRRAEDQARQAQLHAQFEQRFASQAADSRWRRATEARLQDALTTDDPKAAVLQVESVDCRADICKTTLTHETARPNPEFMMRFVSKSAVGLENHFSYANGKTIVYSLRRDDALPHEE